MIKICLLHTKKLIVFVGVSNDLREENLLSQAQSQSTFTSCFVKQMEDNVRSFASFVNYSIFSFQTCLMYYLI